MVAEEDRMRYWWYGEGNYSRLIQGQHTEVARDLLTGFDRQRLSDWVISEMNVADAAYKARAEDRFPDGTPIPVAPFGAKLDIYTSAVQGLLVHHGGSSVLSAVIDLYVHPDETLFENWWNMINLRAVTYAPIIDQDCFFDHLAYWISAGCYVAPRVLEAVGQRALEADATSFVPLMQYLDADGYEVGERWIEQITARRSATNWSPELESAIEKWREVLAKRRLQHTVSGQSIEESWYKALIEEL
jgi:hypothetical protein